MTGDEQQTLFGRRSGKSAAAFRTISEVAAELDVPTHVLRFWEGKFPSVRPMKRGGGRRYYRPEDVELLRRIRSLLYDEGYTIKGAQRVIREAAPREIASAAEPAAESALPAEAPNGGERILGPDLQRELSDILGELRGLRELLDARRPDRGG